MVVQRNSAWVHFAIALLPSGDEDQADVDERAAAADAGLQLAPVIGAQAKSGACLLHFARTLELHIAFHLQRHLRTRSCMLMEPFSNMLPQACQLTSHGSSRCSQCVCQVKQRLPSTGSWLQSSAGT